MRIALAQTVQKWLGLIPDLQLNILSKAIPYLIAFALFIWTGPEIGLYGYLLFFILLLFDILLLSCVWVKIKSRYPRFSFFQIHFQFLFDFFYIGFFIYYTGGLESIFVLLYPVVMIRMMLYSSRPGYFFTDGILGHVYFIITLWVTYGSFEFY
ncbi:MAG: hypothetical protein SCK28_02910, partial [Bacillota bacterium]|nr:hypothetical protein [Bacillota bacterium]